jgi:ABC-type glucose/galactose transport system permease subunit
MTTTTVEPPSAPPEEPTRRIQLSEVSWPELASTIGLLVMAIIFAVINPGYLSEGNVSAILQASAILIVLTIGQMGVQACAKAAAGDELPKNVTAPVAVVSKDNAQEALDAFPAPFEKFQNPLE